MNNEIYNKPLAIKGLTSYRCKGCFGESFIMIGAKDAVDAWNEAKRSTDKPRDMEIWNGEKYVKL
jgi:hypothetical protein